MAWIEFEQLLKLVHYCRNFFRSVKITLPVSETPVAVGELTISGTYRLAWGGDFILCHRVGHRYWPYVTVNMNGRHRKWTANFTIQSSEMTADEIHIVVIELDSTGRVLVDYFLENANKMKWPAIEMIKMPPGFRLCDELIVRRNSS